MNKILDDVAHRWIAPRFPPDGYYQMRFDLERMGFADSRICRGPYWWDCIRHEWTEFANEITYFFKGL